MGDLQKRARILKLELEEIWRLPLSQNMIRKELTVKYKLERLEEQIDVASRQRAHADWLSKGDCNTKYFQVYASEQRRKNTITKLVREDGVVVTGEEGLKALVTNYFSSLFTLMAGADTMVILNNVAPKISAQLYEYLTAD